MQVACRWVIGFVPVVMLIVATAYAPWQPALAQSPAHAIGVGAQLNYPHLGGVSIRYDEFQVSLAVQPITNPGVVRGNIAFRYQKTLYGRK